MYVQSALSRTPISRLSIRHFGEYYLLFLVIIVYGLDDLPSAQAPCSRRTRRRKMQKDLASHPFFFSSSFFSSSSFSSFFLFFLFFLFYLFFFFFCWRYSPLWALACRTIPLYLSLSITNSLHLLTPNT